MLTFFFMKMWLDVIFKELCSYLTMHADSLESACWIFLSNVIEVLLFGYFMNLSSVLKMSPSLLLS